MTVRYSNADALQSTSESMYNKLWAKILDSSVWLTAQPTRIVWITLLASMDKNSFAHFSTVRNLARRANVSDAEAEEAIRILESPDSDSESTEEEGRRIRRGQGGWYVVNGSKYNKLLIEEHVKDLNRQRVMRFRAKAKGNDVMRDSITRNENTCSGSDSDNDYEEGEEEEVLGEEEEGTKKSLGDPVFSLPLNTGVEYYFGSEEIKHWSELYPAVDVMQELRKMRGWCEAKPSNRKTALGVHKFVNGWLARTQDNPRRKGNGGTGKKSLWDAIRDSRPEPEEGDT